MLRKYFITKHKHFYPDLIRYFTYLMYECFTPFSLHLSYIFDKITVLLVDASVMKLSAFIMIYQNKIFQN